MMPILSITIPTYRRERYLKELLLSMEIPAELQNQVEVVVSDNATGYDVESAVAGLNLAFPVRVHMFEVVPGHHVPAVRPCDIGK